MTSLVKSLIPRRVRGYIRGAIRGTSQSGEVRAIKRAIRLCPKPFPKSLVEVGANDGKTLSNSYPFIRAGWRSILMEPLPKAFARLSRLHGSRKAVTCLQLACSDKNGIAKLYLGKDDLLGTICEDENPWFAENRSEQFIEVKVRRLSELLFEHRWPGQFGLLLIDAEGMDYEVLAGLDLRQHRPLLIVTEEYQWNSEKHSRKYALLEQSGYRLLEHVGCNTIWISK